MESGATVGEAEDCYGFIIPNEITSEEELSYLQKPYWSHEVEKKWMQVVSNNVDRNEQEFQELRNSVLENGIPERVRTKVWIHLLGSYEANLYSEMLEKYEELPSGHEIPYQIKLDLPRTFSQQRWFREDPQSMMLLERTLGAYSVLEMKDGYCQSLNFIAGMLLITNEYQPESAFYLMKGVCGRILKGYFGKQLLQAISDTAVFELLIEEKLPEIHHHFKKYNVSVPLFALSWFMTLFTNALTSTTVVHIMDWLFYENDIKVVFQVGLAILQYMKDALLALRTTSDIVEMIKEKTTPIYGKKLMHIAAFEIDQLSSNYISNLRETTMRKQKEELDQVSFRRDVLHLSRTTHFERGMIEQLHNAFREMSKEEGSLNAESFFALFERSFPKLTSEEIKYYWNIFDINKDGEIEFGEFVKISSILFHGTTDEKLKACFECFDTDKSGSIEINEFENMIRTIYSIFIEENHIPDIHSYAVKMFDNLDINPRDGQLSLEEFKAAALVEPLIIRCFCPLDGIGNENKVVKMLSEQKIVNPNNNNNNSNNNNNLRNASTSAKETDSLLKSSAPKPLPEETNCTCCAIS